VIQEISVGKGRRRKLVKPRGGEEKGKWGGWGEKELGT